MLLLKQLIQKQGDFVAPSYYSRPQNIGRQGGIIVIDNVLIIKRQTKIVNRSDLVRGEQMGLTVMAFSEG